LALGLFLIINIPKKSRFVVEAALNFNENY